MTKLLKTAKVAIQIRSLSFQTREIPSNSDRRNLEIWKKVSRARSKTAGFTKDLACYLYYSRQTTDATRLVRAMAAPFAHDLSTATKRSRSQHSPAPLEAVSVGNASSTEILDEAHAKLPAFLRQSKAGKSEPHRSAQTNVHMQAL